MDSRIWIRPSTFLLPQRSVRPSLGLLSLLTGFSGHLLEVLSCFAIPVQFLSLAVKVQTQRRGVEGAEVEMEAERLCPFATVYTQPDCG